MALLKGVFFYPGVEDALYVKPVDKTPRNAIPALIVSERGDDDSVNLIVFLPNGTTVGRTDVHNEQYAAADEKGVKSYSYWNASEPTTAAPVKSSTPVKVQADGLDTVSSNQEEYAAGEYPTARVSETTTRTVGGY